MTHELNKKALVLSYTTVWYNILEGIASITFWLLSNSIALVSFWADSFIESLSWSVMIWRFSKHETLTCAQIESREQKAIKLVGYTFLILWAYVLYESWSKLYFMEKPEPSIIWIIIALLSLVIMPFLAYIKNSTWKKLNSKSLVADSKQTYICVILTVILLLWLSINYFFWIWWTDPIAGLMMSLLIFKEWYSTLKEKELCSC